MAAVCRRFAKLEKKLEEDQQSGSAFDIWTAIQSQKAALSAKAEEEPYVHPLVRRSFSSLSQKSLDMCTESLGSETGRSDCSIDELDLFSNDFHEDEPQDFWIDHELLLRDEVVQEEALNCNKDDKLVAVNYPCAVSRRRPQRSFPPPLSSISSRDGPCFSMRPRRKDGRLVVEAVPVPCQNYLHAQRHGGRLLLSFVTATTMHHQDELLKRSGEEEKAARLVEKVVSLEEEEGEEEASLELAEEEQVEVVDRGTVVEVRVSTQPQKQSGAAVAKVLRSSIVINKFVGGTPLSADEAAEAVRPISPPRRMPPTSGTTAAAAAVVASSLSASTGADDDSCSKGRMAEHGGASAPESKLLFTSRSRNKAELLHNMRRCSELRRPLFYWEPCCIATSS